MRLIDADRLKHKITGITKPHQFVEEIDKRPTVNAIPIEWLYQKRTLYLENECYMSLMVINEILNWWEKENENS